MELTELVKDYTANKLLSNFELDFLEAELWEIIENISYLNSLSIAPEKVCKELGLQNDSSWQLCCAAVLDLTRPEKNKNYKTRVERLKKYIIKYNL